MKHRNVFAALLLASTVLVKVPEASSFIAPYQRNSGGGAVHRLSRMNLQDGKIEASNIEELILSLSVEPTDELRRARLKAIFENLYKNESPENANIFTSQFNQGLITFGDRIQLEVANAERNEAGDYGINPQGHTKPSPLGQKSETELKLWALVDMMVQSKIIVKAASSL